MKIIIKTKKIKYLKKHLKKNLVQKMKNIIYLDKKRKTKIIVYQIKI